MLIIGHRGVAGHYPENTAASIQAAIDLDLTWVEVDVQPCKDGHLVVCHDHTVDRCSNGTGRVDTLTLSALKQLNFAARHEGQVTPQTLLTLEELLTLIEPSDIKLNIEVKVDTHDAQSVCALLASTLNATSIPLERIILSSFSHDVMRELAKQIPQCRRALLTERLKRKDWRLLKEVEATGCNIGATWATKSTVSKLQDAGYEVWCYTINNPKRLKHLSQLDGIFSDYPERFL